MKTKNDTYRLADGNEIPCLGFGTYNPNDSDTREIIRTAIETGYRYFDTASLYETERALGQAIKESGISRSEFYIASKVWIDEMGYEETKAAFARSLERLQTDYLDLYLIHWPRSREDDTNWKERGVQTWRAMEELYMAGKIRSIGLSNFLPHHIENILIHCRVKPVVNQLEVHPGYTQEAACAYCARHGIALQAWSPLGRGKLLSHPLLLALASKYGKTPAQVSLRFLLQKDILPIVKASNAERMMQNADIFDFILSTEDMSFLACLPQTAWSGEHPDYNIPKVGSNLEQ